MTVKVRVTKEGLLIPKEVTDRALGEGSEEVEIIEEAGRLLVSPAHEKPQIVDRTDNEEDPILSMGSDPVDDEITDGAINHDRYLYTGD